MSSKKDLVSLLKDSEEMFTPEQSDYLSRCFSGEKPHKAAKKAYNIEPAKVKTLINALDKSKGFNKR